MTGIHVRQVAREGRFVKRQGAAQGHVVWEHGTLGAVFVLGVYRVKAYNGCAPVQRRAGLGIRRQGGMGQHVAHTHQTMQGGDFVRGQIKLAPETPGLAG